MHWEAVYKDRSRYNSKDHKWSNLPKKGFIKLIITLPDGGKMGVSGWDFYALETLLSGLKVSFWKDTIANDINGNPIHEPRLNQGGNRHFYDDGASDTIKYEDASIIYNGISENLIKNGVWVNDELARELGVL